jgi:hypothetical protein
LATPQSRRHRPRTASGSTSSPPTGSSNSTHGGSSEHRTCDHRPRTLRAPIGLLISTGELVPTKDGKSERPTQLGHFRFKPGQLEQYADAAARAYDVYGQEPKSLDDVYLLSSDIGEVLDIRVKAWSKSGLRIVGMTNFAELPPDEYAARVDAWDDEILYFPRELKDVPARMRDDWQGESIPSTLDGPGDARIKKFEMKVEATFRFCLPQVFGMGPVALYSTGSKHNRDQLYKGVTDAHAWLRGNLIGIPFRFSIRPRRTSYFDKDTRSFRPTQTFEVVFDTPWTFAEAIEAVREQREALGRAPGADAAERLALPAADSALFAGTDARRRDEIEQAIIEAGHNLPAPPTRTRGRATSLRRSSGSTTRSSTGSPTSRPSSAATSRPSCSARSASTGSTSSPPTRLCRPRRARG